MKVEKEWREVTIILTFLNNINENSTIRFNLEFALRGSRIIFSNAIIKIIQSQYKDPLYINCYEFHWYIELEELNNKYWFSSKFWEDKYQSEEFIHIKFSKEYIFRNVKVINDWEEIKEIKNLFPDVSKTTEIEWEIIVWAKIIFPR